MSERDIISVEGGGEGIALIRPFYRGTANLCYRKTTKKTLNRFNCKRYLCPVVSNKRLGKIHFPENIWVE